MDPWKLIQKNFEPSDYGKYETLFTLGNGNLGLRGNLEEADSNHERGTYINGFYETYPIKYGESAYGYARNNQTILNLVDGKLYQIYVDGELFSTQKAFSHIRELDIKEGIITRTFSWLTKSGAEISIKMQRLVSLVNVSTVIQLLEINVVGKKVDLEIVSVLSDGPVGKNDEIKGFEDPRTASFSGKKVLKRIDVTAEGTRAYMGHTTSKSGMFLSTVMDHTFFSKFEPLVSNSITQNNVTIHIKLENMEGGFSLVKYLCYAHARNTDSKKLRSNALADLDTSIRNGFDYYLAAQKSFLADFWDKTDVVIKGDPELQFGLRFNLFHLLQSTGRNGKVSIAAKGLTGLGYEGHYFWDTEIYVLPYYIYTFPEIAKSLLSYRYSIIKKARERAAELSHKGVLFPWRTITGEEASAYYPAGTAQYHINADIAFGICKYVKSTGDMEFLLDYGLEILIETARFWYDLGEFIPGLNGAFCIHEVTGPDEYTALVNNNLYTNIMAGENMFAACNYLRDLKISRKDYYRIFTDKFDISDEEISNWEKAASMMRIPYNTDLSLFAQDDAFLTRPVWDFRGTPPDKYPLLLHFHPLTIYRYQVIKQADVVMALFLQGHKFSHAEKKRNFDYYEKLTTGDSSLSACIQGIVGAELGYLELAENYFRQTVLIDLKDLNGNVRDGVHTASMAGSWMSVIYGFAGMRDTGNVLSFSPRLPDSIDKISFKINHKGCLLSVLITRDKVVYALLKGDNLEFNNYYRNIHLVSGERVSLSLLPKLRVVLIDTGFEESNNNLKNRCMTAGIKYVVMEAGPDVVPPPDPQFFLDFIENLKIKRWDCLGITRTEEGAGALKTAEMAYIKVENIKNLSFNKIITSYKEFSSNWNRGIKYSAH